MIISVVLTLIQKKLPKYVHATQTDIQVLTPMRKGLLGVERLNEILQHYLNPVSYTHLRSRLSVRQDFLIRKWRSVLWKARSMTWWVRSTRRRDVYKRQGWEIKIEVSSLAA